MRGCRFLDGDLDDESLGAGRVRCHRQAQTTSGRTTSSSNTSATGQQIKCLTVVDEWTREALAIDVAGSIRSGRVIEVLSKLVSTRGAPRYLRSDNGPEFISTAVLRWVTEEGIETAHIAPGKPWENGTNESFNGEFRDECLSMEWFRTRREAAATIETYRTNSERSR